MRNRDIFKKVKQFVDAQATNLTATATTKTNRLLAGGVTE